MQVLVFGEELDDVLRHEIQTHVTRALQLQGDDPQVLNLLATAYDALDDGETTLRLARRLVEMNPGSPYSRYSFSRAYARLA